MSLYSFSIVLCLDDVYSSDFLLNNPWPPLRDFRMEFNFEKKLFILLLLFITANIDRMSYLNL